MKTFTCPTCNQGEVKDVARAGRRMHFRNIPDLEIPADITIPTCTHGECGEEWMDRATATRVEEAMKIAYQTALTAKAEEAIARLKKKAPQRDLERILGLSAGYLSKLKNGKETTAPLVAALMLLASDLRRVDELKALWAMQPPQEASCVKFSSTAVEMRHRKISHARLAPVTVEARVKLQNERGTPEISPQLLEALGNAA